MHDLLPEVEPLFLVRYPGTRRQLKEMGFPALLIGETLGWEHKAVYTGSAKQVFGADSPPRTWQGISLNEVTHFEGRLAQLQGRPEDAVSALVQAGEIAERFLALASWWRPQFVLCWNGWTLPWSVANALGRKHGAFVLCAERGLVPDSLVLDSEGVNAGSYLAGEKWRRIAEREPSAGDREWASEYRRRYREERRTVVSKRGATSHTKVATDELGIPADAMVVLCPAQLDEDTNPVLFAPEFPTNASVLEALRSAALNLGRIFVLFKTHPEDLSAPQDYSRLLQGIGAMVGDVPLHDLLDVAQVVVTRNSTVGFEGLLAGKPVIALGRALWTGKGFTNDIRGREDLAHALAAMQRSPQLSGGQEETFTRFLIYLLGRYHYYLDPKALHERESNRRKLEFLRAGIAAASPTWPPVTAEAEARWRERLDREVDVRAWVGRSGSHYHNLMRAGARRILLVKACRPETLRAAAERFQRDFQGARIDILCRRFDPRDAPAAGCRHLLMTRPGDLLAAARGGYDAIVYCLNARVGFPRALRVLSPLLRAPVRLVTQDAFDPRLMDTPAGRARLKPRKRARAGQLRRPTGDAAVSGPPPPAPEPAAPVDARPVVALPPAPPEAEATPEEQQEVEALRTQLPKRRPYTQESLLSLLAGEGIEIGALHSPAPLDSKRAHVLYVDNLPLDDLRERYGKNVGADRIRAPDVVCDGATLAPFLPSSLDFIVARHLLEHLPDPLAALIRWHEVLRPGGLLFLSLPHREHTFDKERPRTTLEHLLADYREPSAVRDFEHYLEWAEKVNNRAPGGPAFQRATELALMGYAIHYHVWEPPDIEEIFSWLGGEGYGWYLVACEPGHPQSGVFYLWMKAARDPAAEWAHYEAARSHYRATGKLWQIAQAPAPRLRARRPDVSACVVNWNTKDLLRECLRSLDSSRHCARMETIVVDNGSTDGSAEMVAQEFSAVTVIANTENLKFARANNQALLRARGRYLLLVNSDIVVLPGSIDRMVTYLDSHRDVGMVTCRLIYPDGRPQNSCLNFPSLLTEFSDVSGLQRRYPRNPLWARYTMAGWDHGETRDVEQPMASFVLVRREVLDAVGYLDPRFPIYYNDVDWCLRIKRAGWRIVYLADARVIHHRRATADRLGAWRMVEHHLGKLRFFRKHYGMTGYGLVWLMNMTRLVPRYLGLRFKRTLARRRKQRFDEREKLWECAKLLRVYLGLRLGS
jgi:hypothetical protein